MSTWKTLANIAALVAFCAMLSGGACVVDVVPIDTGGDWLGGGDDATTITVVIINATNTTLDPEIYVSAENVGVQQLFQPARKYTRFGVGTLGLLGPSGSDSFELECTAVIVLGTQGGAFGDDLNNPDGTGRQIVLTQDLNVYCGDTVRFTFTGSGTNFDTSYQVTR